MLFHLSSPVSFFSHLLDSGRALDLIHGSFYVEVSMDSVGLYPLGSQLLLLLSNSKLLRFGRW